MIGRQWLTVEDIDSIAAPEMTPFCSADINARSLTTGPRDVFTRNAVFFISVSWGFLVVVKYGYLVHFTIHGFRPCPTQFASRGDRRLQ